MAKKEQNFLSIDFILNRKRKIIPFSPSLDVITGGGVSESSWNILVGPPKVGKTTTILHFCKQAQKPENGGRKVFYANIEGRLSERDITSCIGLDHSKFFIISSTPEEKDENGEVIVPAKILDAEQYLTICEQVLKDNPGCVLVIDSESMLVTNTELTSGMDEMQRADGAKLMAKFARKVSGIISTNNNIIFSVRHVSSNPTGYGAPIKEKGSFAGMYQTDMKLSVKNTEKWEVQEKIIGQKINWKLETGCLEGAIPQSIITGYLRYGSGIDELSELVQLGTDFGILESKGAWIAWNGEKYNGHEKLCQSLRDNPVKQIELFTQIKEILK